MFLGTPSLEESRKQQFQQFLNQNDRGQDEPTSSGGDSLKSSRMRFKSVQTYDEPVKLRQLIESLLEVQCTSTDMTVKLHYDSSYSKLTPTLVDALSGGILYVGSSESGTTCRGRPDELAGEIKLTMGYGSCRMNADHISDSTILYSTTVRELPFLRRIMLLWSSDHLTVSFGQHSSCLFCAIPFRLMSNSVIGRRAITCEVFEKLIKWHALSL